MTINPNYIIIGSTGRNTGKTEFACRLIKQYSHKHIIYGVKVLAINRKEGNCPHGGKGCGICTTLKDDYDIVEELAFDTGKDTSRMLIAGASKVYLLKVDKDRLEVGLAALQRVIPENVLVVVESNSIRKVLLPAVFIVIQNKEDNHIKRSCKEVIQFADRIIQFDRMNWDFSPEEILVENNTWAIRKKATAIILAGGKSSRMEGEDKGLLPINNVPLIQHIVNQLNKYFDQIIIGSNSLEKYSFLNLQIVPDLEKDKGPLMGIISCLQASNNEINFITACDIPEMNFLLINELMHFASDFDIVMPVNGNNYEPLFAVYKKTVINKAKEVVENNGRRIVDLLNHVSVHFVNFDSNDWYQNLNSKEDYQGYIRKINSRH